MNVATITMPKDAALKKLAAYRASALRGVDKEYDAAYQGYKALAKGTALLHIEDAIRNGGLDETHQQRCLLADEDPCSCGPYISVVSRRTRHERFHGGGCDA